MVETGYRQLVIIRHAKTEREASSDRARELTSRGRRDAEAAGRWLREQAIQPDVLLVSPAARARATADLVVQALEVAPEVRVVEELYQASADEALDIVAGVDQTARVVAVVGHNPTMEELAHLLPAGDTEPADDDLPTAGIVVLAVPDEWSDIAAGSTEVVERHVARG